MGMVPIMLFVQATPSLLPESGHDPLDTAVKMDWSQLTRLVDWLGGVSATLLVTGIIVGVFIWVTGRLRRKLRHTLSARVKGRNNLPALIDNLLSIGVYIISGMFAFSALGADSSAFVQSIGLITAAISLSLQDVLKNFVAGIYLLSEMPFAAGDRLEVANQVGVVERVNVRTTVLRNDRAQQVLVPNYTVFSSVVTNRSTYNLQSLTILVEGVKRRYPEVLADRDSWLRGIDGLSRREPEIELTKVGPDGCNLTVTVWVTPKSDVRHAVIGRLVDLFPDATLTVSA